MKRLFCDRCNRDITKDIFNRQIKIGKIVWNVDEQDWYGEKWWCNKSMYFCKKCYKEIKNFIREE